MRLHTLYQQQTCMRSHWNGGLSSRWAHRASVKEMAVYYFWLLSNLPEHRVSTIRKPSTDLNYAFGKQFRYPERHESEGR